MYNYGYYYFSDLAVATPIDLLNCNTGAATYDFNLTINNEIALGIDSSIYDVFTMNL